MSLSRPQSDVESPHSSSPTFGFSKTSHFKKWIASRLPPFPNPPQSPQYSSSPPVSFKEDHSSSSNPTTGGKILTADQMPSFGSATLNKVQNITHTVSDIFDTLKPATFLHFVLAFQKPLSHAERVNLVCSILEVYPIFKGLLSFVDFLIPLFTDLFHAASVIDSDTVPKAEPYQHQAQAPDFIVRIFGPTFDNPFAKIIMGIIGMISMVITGTTAFFTKPTSDKSSWFQKVKDSAQTCTSLAGVFKVAHSIVPSFLTSFLGYEPDDPLTQRYNDLYNRCTTINSAVNDFNDKTRLNPGHFYDCSDKFLQLYKEAVQLHKELLELPADVSAKLSSITRQTIKSLVDFKCAIADYIKGNALRPEPVVIWIWGDPGHGKSTWKNILIKALGEELKQPLSVYEHSSHDKYCSTYQGQQVCCFNDMGLDPTAEDLKFFLNWVDTNPCTVTKAAVEDKGMPFCSRFIIVCSNQAYYAPRSQVVTPEACHRRRDLLIRPHDYNYKIGTQNNHRTLDGSHLTFYQYPVFPMDEKANPPTVVRPRHATFADPPPGPAGGTHLPGYNAEICAKQLIAIYHRKQRQYDLLVGSTRPPVTLYDPYLPVDHGFDQPLAAYHDPPEQTEPAFIQVQPLEPEPDLPPPPEPEVTLNAEAQTANFNIDAEIALFHRLIDQGLLAPPPPDMSIEDFVRDVNHNPPPDEADVDLMTFEDDVAYQLYQPNIQTTRPFIYTPAFQDPIHVPAPYIYQAGEQTANYAFLILGQPGLGKSTFLHKYKQHIMTPAAFCNTDNDTLATYNTIAIDDITADAQLFPIIVHKVMALHAYPKPLIIMTGNNQSMTDLFHSQPKDLKQAFLRRCHQIFFTPASAAGLLESKTKFQNRCTQQLMAGLPFDAVVRLVHMAPASAKREDINLTILHSLIRDATPVIVKPTLAKRMENVPAGPSDYISARVTYSELKNISIKNFLTMDAESSLTKTQTVKFLSYFARRILPYIKKYKTLEEAIEATANQADFPRVDRPLHIMLIDHTLTVWFESGKLHYTYIDTAQSPFTPNNLQAFNGRGVPGTLTQAAMDDIIECRPSLSICSFLSDIVSIIISTTGFTAGVVALVQNKTRKHKSQFFQINWAEESPAPPYQEEPSWPASAAAQPRPIRQPIRNPTHNLKASHVSGNGYTMQKKASHNSQAFEINWADESPAPPEELEPSWPGRSIVRTPIRSPAVNLKASHVSSGGYNMQNGPTDDSWPPSVENTATVGNILTTQHTSFRKFQREAASNRQNFLAVFSHFFRPSSDNLSPEEAFYSLILDPTLSEDFFTSRRDHFVTYLRTFEHLFDLNQPFQPPPNPLDQNQTHSVYQLAFFSHSLESDSTAVDVAVAIYKNMFRVTSNHGTCWAIPLRDNYFITVGHIFDDAHPDSLYITYKNEEYSARPIAASDNYDFLICQTHAPLQFPSTMKSWILETDKINSKNLEGIVPVLRGNSLLIQPVKFSQMIRFESGALAGCIGVRAVPNKLHAAKFDSRVGDCGMPYLHCSPSTPRRLLGFHNAGNGQTGFGSVITRELIEACINTKHTQEAEPIKILDYQQVSPDLSFALNHKGEKDLTAGPTRTKLKSTPFHNPNCGVEPSILSRTDPRNPEHIDPMLDGQTRWSKSLIEDPFDNDLMASCFQDIENELVTLFKSKSFSLSKLTRTAALNYDALYPGMSSLPSSSSAGLPWSHLPGTRHKTPMLIFDVNRNIFDINREHELGKKFISSLDSLQSHCTRRIRTAVLFDAHLKDEVLPHRKIESVATRIILGGPLELTVLHRQYFAALSNLIVRTHNDHPIKVGINPYTEWDILYNQLIATSDTGFDTDFKGWDYSIQPDLFKFVPICWANIYSRLDPNSTLDDYNTRLGIYDHIIQPLISWNGKLIHHNCGMPSGQPMTAIDNSLMNWALQAYCWKTIFKDTPLASYSCYRQNITPAFYGDDNITAVPESLQSQFNLDNISPILTKAGMTITPGQKTSSYFGFQPIKDLTFLSRFFNTTPSMLKCTGGKVVGSLKTDSIKKLISYVNTSKADKWISPEANTTFEEEPLSAIFTSACYEFAMLGPQIYNNNIPRMARTLQNLGIQAMAPTHRQILVALGHLPCEAFTSMDSAN